MLFSKNRLFKQLQITFVVYLLSCNIVMADFFDNISNLIENNIDRLSYGVSVTDINQDGKFEFVVTGFGADNLALGYDDGIIKNLVKNNNFNDTDRRTIGVAACDIDQDGYEEVYFLNTDTYSGEKQYSDRLLDIKQNQIIDLFSLDKNMKELNYTAGRSVACVDREGNGKYGIYIANYGGPTRFYEYHNGSISDQAPYLKIDQITGGRAIVVGHILSDYNDIFAANERGANFLYRNDNGNFVDVANEFEVQDIFQNGRGTTLSNIFYDGELGIINGNWMGYHRTYVRMGDKFKDIAKPDFDTPTRVRTIISADFDNDGYDEVFINNIGEPNKLFKILQSGEFEKIDLNQALEPNGLGTGAAVADIDNDGILELLISHGESGEQPLSLYKANVPTNHKYIRIKPINTFGAPARGATVKLYSDQRIHAKTIDAGSGYLCQMEPVAHYGIRNSEVIEKIEVKWTNGEVTEYKDFKINETLVINQLD